MNKIKTFCSYSRFFDTSDLLDGMKDDDYYPIAISQLAKQILNSDTPTIFDDKKRNDDVTKQLVFDILFWAIYRYGKYTMQEEKPIIEVEVEHLPINMSKEEFKLFKKGIKIVVDHYNSITYGIQKPSLILMEDFKPYFERTEKYTMEIPAVWLGT